MEAFSEPVIQIYKEILWYGNYRRAEEIYPTLETSAEKATALSYLSLYLLWVQEIDQLFEKIAELEEMKTSDNNPYVEFFYYFVLFFYYSGVNNPLVDRSKSENYRIKSLETLSQISLDRDRNEWEFVILTINKIGTEDWYNSTRETLEKTMQLFRDASFYEPIIEARYSEFFGSFYRRQGDLETALKYYEVDYPYDNPWMKFIYALNTAQLSHRLGNMKKFEDTVTKSLPYFKKKRFLPALSFITRELSVIYLEKNNYEEAEKRLEEYCDYQCQRGYVLHHFWGHYEMFRFYYKRYLGTKDRRYLDKAEFKIEDFSGYTTMYEDNITMINYVKISKATINKHKNLVLRVEAMKIFEEMIAMYPSNFALKLDLLDILLEDYKTIDDPKTLERIDEIMDEIRQLPFAMTKDYVSQQKLLARHMYVIKGNLNGAIEMLEEVHSQLKENGMNFLANEIHKDLELLYDLVNTWNTVDKTIKDRLKNDSIQNYIQKVLAVMNN